MQEMPLDFGQRPAAQLRPIFPTAGRAISPRLGRLARQIGHDGTRNFAHAQALLMRQNHGKPQRTLAKAAIVEANKRVRNATCRFGVMPKFMHKKDFQPCASLMAARGMASTRRTK